MLKDIPGQKQNLTNVLQGTLVQVISEKCQCFTIEHQVYMSDDVSFFSSAETTTTSLKNLHLHTSQMIPHHFSTFVPKNTFGFILESKAVKELYEHSIEVGSRKKKTVPVDTVMVCHYLKIYFQNDACGWVDVKDLLLI